MGDLRTSQADDVPLALNLGNTTTTVKFFSDFKAVSALNLIVLV